MASMAGLDYSASPAMLVSGRVFDMTIVYRVQHSVTGHGPYAYPYDDDVAFFLVELRNHGYDPYAHPGLWRDLQDCDKAEPFWPGKRHGFDSLEKLMAWFDNCERFLDEKGFEIAVYEVPENRVCRAQRQVIFDPNHATRKR